MQERDLGDSWFRRWLWFGAVPALLVGLVYGWRLGEDMGALYYDCGQPSPGFAVLGVFGSGMMTAPFILAPITTLLYVLSLRRPYRLSLVECVFLPRLGGRSC